MLNRFGLHRLISQIKICSQLQNTRINKYKLQVGITAPKRYFSENQQNSDNISNTQDKINLSDEDKNFVFKTREQQISVKLMSIQTSEDVLSFYEQQKSINNDLSIDEQCLFVYFTGFYKGDFIQNSSFKELFNKVASNVDSLSPIYLSTFVWCLSGILQPHYGVTLTADQKELLSRSLLNKIWDFPLNQLSTLILATSQILKAGEDFQNLREILKSFLQLSVKNTGLLTTNDITNYIMISQHVNYHDVNILDKLTERALNIQYEFSIDEITRILSCLDSLGYHDNKLYKEFFEVISTKIDDVSADSAGNLILVYVNAKLQDHKIIKQLLKKVHNDMANISITNYVNIWLALAKIKVDLDEYEKTIRLLKERLIHGGLWHINELEPFELVNIVVSISSLRINDKNFVAALIPHIKNQIKNTDHKDLHNLTKAFIIYVKQFEDFFVELHQICSSRIDEFDKHERQSLKDTFYKVKYLFAKSPFFELV